MKTYVDRDWIAILTVWNQFGGYLFVVAYRFTEVRFGTKFASVTIVYVRC